MRTKLFVFDVNTFVSAFIVGSDKNAKAFDKALELGRVVYTHGMWLELTEVFLRAKFDKYLSFNFREKLLLSIEEQLLEWPDPTEVISACRDPKDNKYLELAVSCKASAIVTGDKDLLVLNPFRNIPIINSGDFLLDFSR